MKKLSISLTVLFVLVMSACSNSSTDKKNDAKGSKSETITYTNKELCEMIVDNPAGQSDQCTPFLIINCMDICEKKQEAI